MTDIIFIGLGIGLLGIGVLGTIVFGIRSSFLLGNADLKKALVMLVPFVIFGIAYFATNSADQAGVVTMLILAALMVLAIAFTGLKGTFKF